MRILPSRRIVGVPPSSLLVGLTSHWAVEETGAASRPDVKGVNPLTAVNAPGNTTGKVGNAVSFVAASSQRLTAAITPGSQAKMTIASWINRGAANTFAPVGWGDTSGSRFNILPHTDTNVYARIETTVSGLISSADNLTGWHHYVVVYDSTLGTDLTRCKLYRDGVALVCTASGTLPSGSLVPTGAFVVGAEVNLSRFANCPFDEVGLWYTALTATQILNMYNAENAGVGYPWPGVP